MLAKDAKFANKYKYLVIPSSAGRRWGWRKRGRGEGGGGTTSRPDTEGRALHSNKTQTLLVFFFFFFVFFFIGGSERLEKNEISYLRPTGWPNTTPKGEDHKEIVYAAVSQRATQCTGNARSRVKWPELQLFDNPPRVRQFLAFN